MPGSTSTFPIIGSDAEDWLTSTTGLDEEELGLPSQAGAASTIEDVLILSTDTGHPSVP